MSSPSPYAFSFVLFLCRIASAFFSKEAPFFSFLFFCRWQNLQEEESWAIRYKSSIISIINKQINSINFSSKGRLTFFLFFKNIFIQNPELIQQYWREKTKSKATSNINISYFKIFYSHDVRLYSVFLKLHIHRVTQYMIRSIFLIQIQEYYQEFQEYWPFRVRMK